MRPSQLLRNSWQQLHHSAVSLYPAFYHEQEFAAVGNRYGLAAVIAPISQIDDLDVNKSYVIAKDGKPGPVCEKLYNKLRAIQYGDEPDTYGWITIIE